MLPTGSYLSEWPALPLQGHVEAYGLDCHTKSFWWPGATLSRPSSLLALGELALSLTSPGLQNWTLLPGHRRAVALLLASSRRAGLSLYRRVDPDGRFKWEAHGLWGHGRAGSTGVLTPDSPPCCWPTQGGQCGRAGPAPHLKGQGTDRGQSWPTQLPPRRSAFSIVCWSPPIQLHP